MAVVRKKPKMKRTQISLPLDQYEAVKRMAGEREVSLSQVLRDAIQDEMDQERVRVERMLSIIGMVEGTDPLGSVTVDEVVYGEDIR